MDEKINELLNKRYSQRTEMKKVQEILRKIMESGYRPFTTENPTHEELEIKNSLIQSLCMIDKAYSYDVKIYK